MRDTVTYADCSVMEKRQFLSGVAAVVCGGLAGCSGISSGPSPPDENANPQELLPEPPDGWTQTQSSQQSAGLVGAEAGYGAGYDDSSGTHYGVEILRWSSNDEAKNRGKEVYSGGWSVYTVNGNFGFAGNGPDVDSVYLLLGGSSALTKKYAKNNNIIE